MTVRKTPATLSKRRRALTTIVVITALLSTVLSASPAVAVEYPTWEEVVAAQASEASTKTLLTTIQGQLQNLTSETDKARAEAHSRGLEFEAADQKFQEAAFDAARLSAQAALAEKTAASSRAKVAQIVAYQSRASGTDLTAVLLARSEDAAQLLDRLEFTSKLADANSALFSKATQDGNIARTRTEQAQRVTTETAKFKATASSALRKAQQASDAADAALSAQAQISAELTAQLTILTTKRIATEADFSAGTAARAAAQAAAAAAAAAQLTSQPRPAGTVSIAGWVNPTVGALVSPYGYRIHPIYKTYRLHGGIDLAGGCNQPIYATAAGRVIFSGDNGGFGNYILIQHDGNEQSAYAHIIDGGRLVQDGQTVAVGQMIARTGSTGASTGCHLHFEIRTNGTAIDPVPFLRDRGVTVG